MISILLATGFEKLDNTLANYYKKDTNIEILGQRVYFREGLTDSIMRNKPTIVLLTDKLEGNTLSLEQLIRLTRRKHPKTRLVFIMSDKDNHKLKKLLYQLSVFDVFSLEPKLNVKELTESFSKPKEWKDVAHHFPDLEDDESFEVDEDFILNAKDGLIIEEDYSSFETKLKQNVGSVFHKTAAIWSIRQQSGTTFLGINTALLLAQHLDQKILLVDFNPNNPNVHIQFNLEDMDGNHNLAALCEDIESNYIKGASDVSDYLYTHPFYSNLNIMFGSILKTAKPKQETIIQALHLILEFARNEEYTTVLFDLESGLEEPFIVEVLKAVNIILSPITDSPGSIIAAQKIFDREFGPFFLNFLDLKKMYPILNKTGDEENREKIKHFLQSILNTKIEVSIPFSEEITSSINYGSPLLKKGAAPELMVPLTRVANSIHNVFSVPPVDEKRKPEKKRFGIF
ncbi:hypothetical protein [Bacillus toyonensis]|uniref:hypothetical protein n=1 Tax=Bacillus toyonensis TaxID=155322 RepID=UPI002E2031B8|nr:hypothetical protein [Bacillus toyonensis]